jgi:CheY-like chemotaxis protein
MRRPGHLLVAEDDENDVFLLRRAFAEVELTNPCHVVGDGQEAIEYLSGMGKYADRAQYPLPALLILDLKMPRRTGMEVLAWLQKQEVLYCLPVMVLSSSAHPGDVDKAYRLGSNAFVSKPSEKPEREILARLIKDFWLTFNQPPLLSTEGLEAAQAKKKISQPFEI